MIFALKINEQGIRYRECTICTFTISNTLFVHEKKTLAVRSQSAKAADPF